MLFYGEKKKKNANCEMHMAWSIELQELHQYNQDRGLVHYY